MALQKFVFNVPAEGARRGLHCQEIDQSPICSTVTIPTGSSAVSTAGTATSITTMTTTRQFDKCVMVLPPT